MVSTSVIVTQIIELVVILLVPLLAMFYLGFKMKAKVFPYFAGLATYVFFSLELESVILAMILGSMTTGDNPASRAVLSGVLSTIFEIGGAYLAYKLLYKAYPKKQDGLAFGAGFAWMEGIVAAGITSFVNASYASVLNEMGAEKLIASFEEADGVDASGIVDNILSLTASAGVAATFARLAFIVFDIAVIFMVYTAISKKMMAWFGLALALKFFISLPETLMDMGTLTNEWVALVIILIPAAVAVFAGCRLYKGYDYDEIELTTIFSSKQLG